MRHLKKIKVSNSLPSSNDVDRLIELKAKGKIQSGYIYNESTGQWVSYSYNDNNTQENWRQENGYE